MNASQSQNLSSPSWRISTNVLDDTEHATTRLLTYVQSPAFTSRRVAGENTDGTISTSNSTLNEICFLQQRVQLTLLILAEARDEALKIDLINLFATKKFPNKIV